MARKVKTGMQNEVEKEAAKDLASSLELSCQEQGESIDEILKNIQEAVDRYLEALAAEENENRLSR